MAKKVPTLGAYIGRLRCRHRYTQTELAEEMGVSQSMISRWESDGGTPSLRQLHALADTFETKAWAILREVQRPAEQLELG